MATQAVQKKGFIVGFAQSSQAAARDIAGGTVTNTPSGDQSSIQVFRSSGRGGGTFRYTRTFLRFDTSGISGASSFILNIAEASTSDTDRVFVLKSDAFNGEDTTLESADFNNLDFSTLFSDSSQGDAWSAGSGAINITLNNAAAQQINNNNTLTVALVTSHDYNDTGLEEDGDITNRINFSGTIQLTFTEASSGYGNAVIGVASGNIAKVNGVATANIEAINTI